MAGGGASVPVENDIQGSVVIVSRFVGTAAAQGIVDIYELHDACWQGDAVA